MKYERIYDPLTLLSLKKWFFVSTNQSASMEEDQFVEWLRNLTDLPDNIILDVFDVLGLKPEILSHILRYKE